MALVWYWHDSLPFVRLTAKPVIMRTISAVYTAWLKM
jgi:hypothetical protein